MIFFVSASAFCASIASCACSRSVSRSPMPRRREMNRGGSNFSRSSIFSPTPRKTMGAFTSATAESAPPPFAVPASFVTMTPVIPTASWNAFACGPACWPTVASRTRSRSSAWTALPTDSISLIRSGSSACRPDESTTITSMPSSALTPARAILTASLAAGQPLLLEVLRELPRGGRLALAVQADEQDPLFLERHVAARAEDPDEFLVDDPDDVLARAHARRRRFLQGAPMEFPGDRQRQLDVHVRLDERPLDVSDDLLDEGLVDVARTGDLAERRTQGVAELLKDHVSTPRRRRVLRLTERPRSSRERRPRGPAWRNRVCTFTQPSPALSLLRRRS